MVLFAGDGLTTCLDNSLKASNKGCSKPKNTVLFGPNRIWNDPMTLRSNRV